MKLLFCFWLTAFLTLCIVVVGGVDRSSDRVSTKIYKNIGGALACFRRMNGTHTIGCQSSMAGDVGVIHFVNETQEELDVNWITRDGPHPPYIAVLYPSSFRGDILNKFSSSGRVNGILLLNSNDTKEFSTDKSCPNQGYGLYRNPESQHYCSNWNDQSSRNDLLFYDWKFPIFYVPDEEDMQSLQNCFEKFNRPIENGKARDWPLCAAQLQSFMSAAVDTPTCLRRSQFSPFSISPRKDCDPLGNRNLIATLFPTNHSETSQEFDEGSVIVIAARIDAASFFDKLYPGADSAGTGVTAVLAILKQLSSIKEKLFETQTEIKNVYFILFNGEAFDYIGSSRVIYDMANNNFPIPVNGNDTSQRALLQMKNIKYFIELNQVSLFPSGSYYIHQNWDVDQKNLSPLVDLIKSAGHNFSVNIQQADSQRPSDWFGVPPSSLQSFLGNNSNFPGIVITNHRLAYKNKVYNSIFDDDTNLDYSDTVQSISRLAAAIARTVERLIIGNHSSLISEDTKSVEDILECYVKSGRCELFQNVTSLDIVQHLRDKPNYYVGVASSTYDLLQITSITKNVMIYFQGDIEEKNQSDCHADSGTKNVEYVYLNGSCYKTTVISTQAISPAFEIDNYDWKSGQYSSWTESVWSEISVRIFLKPSFAHELITLISGIVVFGLSFILVGWISSKTDMIFPTRAEQVC